MASPLVTCKKGPSIISAAPASARQSERGYLQMLARTRPRAVSSRQALALLCMDTHMTVHAAVKTRRSILGSDGLMKNAKSAIRLLIDC